MQTFQCVICLEEWLQKSMPLDFILSQPQGGKGVCENCVEKLYEEPFEKKHRKFNAEERHHYIKTTESPQPESFSYNCYATTSEPGGPWTESYYSGRRVFERPMPARSKHCRRILRITIPCCAEECENVEVVVHLTENTVRGWGAGPLRVWFERGALWYKSAYYECCGIEHPPDNGDEVEEWRDRFCEAENHECESCKDWFENNLYTHEPELLKSAYLAMKANPSPENREEYEGLAMHLRRKWSTQKPQIAATTNILDAFLGEDPTGCIRSGLTVGPTNAGESNGRCGFRGVKSRDIEIPLSGGRFIGNGYLCEEHD